MNKLNHHPQAVCSLVERLKNGRLGVETRDSERLLLTVTFTTHTVHTASVCIRRDRYGVALCFLFLLIM